MKFALVVAVVAVSTLQACDAPRQDTASEKAEQPERSKKKKKKKKDAVASASADAGSSAAPSASAKPADGWSALEGNSISFSMRAPAGFAAEKYKNGDKLTGETDDGKVTCYVNHLVSQFAKPKDMGQAIREFTSMGYAMKPSWQHEADGNFYGQLDKVKGAAVDADITVKGIVTTDQPKSLRISCYGATEQAEMLRKMVKSVKWKQS